MNLQLEEQFLFDDSFEFPPSVSVYPYITVNGSDPIIWISAYGTNTKLFKKLIIKTTIGETKTHQEKGDNDDMEYYFLPYSKSGEITISIGNDTYTLSWDHLDEYTTKFTNHFSNASILFIKDYGIAPNDITKLKEHYIELYQSVDSTTETASKFKAYLFNKLQEIQSLGK
jgi:hypothetical protein